MSKTIDVFEHGTEERKKLDLMASMLTFLSPNRKQYVVDETYFDFGQKWVWTTILAECDMKEFGRYQALCPRQQEEILAAETLEDIAELARAFLADDTYKELKK